MKCEEKQIAELHCFKGKENLQLKTLENEKRCPSKVLQPTLLEFAADSRNDDMHKMKPSSRLEPLHTYSPKEYDSLWPKKVFGAQQT